MVIGRLPDLNLKLFCRGWLLSAFALLSLVDMSGLQAALAPGEAERLKELDAYWSEVSRAVKEGDFDGYKATCHPEGVMVSGASKRSYPLAEALAGWEKDFIATKQGKLKASVQFRFSKRFGSSTTAHETGIFLYSTEDELGGRARDYVHFEALLIKEGDKWKILMEYQKSNARPSQWDALAVE